ncbi:TetR family transcriptional regulator [Specibacter sp. AOP5-B1-6]|uniref:TetR family transcriptional regulator n=1 Tax=Specibacter sp. AOP5-B1-6 TaxID=3457653 RepID=UPI00402BB306
MEARPPEGPSSRYKILWAAATMLGGDSATTPSVRAVAVRAGVSAGSVQHHFPTQRELMDEVLILVYDTVLQAKGSCSVVSSTASRSFRRRARSRRRFLPRHRCSQPSSKCCEWLPITC